MLHRDWYAAVSKTLIYLPEDVGGSALKKLFQNNFQLKIGSSKEEASLRGDLLWVWFDWYLKTIDGEII